MKTLQELFEEFISECQYSRRLSSETLRGYRQVFSLLLRVMPNLSIDTLTPKTINEFFRVLQTRIRIVGKGAERSGISDATVVTYRSKLLSFFDWLVTRQLLITNPLRAMGSVRRTSYEDPKSLRKREIERIIMAIENRSESQLQLKRDRAILNTLLFTGIRKGELIGLQKDDLDLERKMLVVRGENSKSGRTRQITVHPNLLMRLDDYLEERSRSKSPDTSPYLFVSLLRDTGLGSDGYKHWVARLKRLSGINFHLHRFRHTFAMNLANKNVNDSKVQRILGHLDIRMTQRYLRSLTPEDMRKDIDGLSMDDLI